MATLKSGSSHDLLDMPSTADALITFAENITKVDRATIGVPGLEETMLLAVVDRENEKYLNNHIKVGGEPPETLRREVGFDLVADTNLTAAVATTDIIVVVTDSSNFPVSGAFVIWDAEMPDITFHTGNDLLTTFSGVTSIGFSHEIGDRVQRVYQLPADFESVRSTHRAHDGVLLNGFPVSYSSAFPRGNTFNIIDNGTNQFIWFSQGVSNDAFMWYNASPTNITLTTDVVDVPFRDEYYIVWGLVEHIREVLQRPVQDIREARLKANEIMLDALKRRNVGKRVRTARMPRFSRERLIFRPEYR